MEQILSQPDPMEFDTTTDGCSTSSYVSTVSSTSFLYLHSSSMWVKRLSAKL